MIVTIDGPAKSGKSKAAELLAAATGFRLLNTGAMYRAAGLFLRESGYEPDLGDTRYHNSLVAMVDAFEFDMTDGVRLNGQDYSHLVGSPEAGHLASVVGQYPLFREKLKAEQRRIAAIGRMICEGRDQGTSVFPEAPVKFYVTASPSIRAGRMALTMTGTPDLDDLERQIRERDDRDSTRALDPLRPATDAIVISTDTMTAEAVAEMMKERVERCRDHFTV
jgi:CMP/dCMP kinase